jgi:hypothetical protein
MKKLMFWMPLAAIALASCSNDEQVSQVTRSDVQELTIRPIVGNVTRSITTDANFTEFYLTAVATTGEFWPTQVSGESTSAPTKDANAGATTTLTGVVTKNPTSGRWELVTANSTSNTWYWSSKNAVANFTASNVQSNSVTIADAVADQKDVLVAYNSGTASSFTNGVPLLFRHVLSQIVIKADNKDADIRQIKVAAVRIHNVGKTNTLTLPATKTTADDFKWDETSYTPWTNEPGDKTSKFYYYKGTTAPNAGTVSESITLNATAQEITFDGAVLQLPQTNAGADLAASSTSGSYIDVLVQVQNLEATTNVARSIYPTVGAEEETQLFAWVAVPVAITWKPGYKYTYVLHFSKDGIGKVSPDTDGGDPDPGPGAGEEIVDNPVPLYFTVTIDEWNDASTSPEEKDL